MSERRRSAAAPPPPFAEVFHEHAPFAWRVLRRLGLSEADADDACQDVFVAAHRHLDDFEGRSSVRTWLYGICVRVASNQRRQVRRRREQTAVPSDEGAVEANQETAVALREAKSELDRILDALDDDKRAVFVLYEIEELPMTDVAEAVGCPLQTAYSRLHAARSEVELAIGRMQRRAAVP